MVKGLKDSRFKKGVKTFYNEHFPTDRDSYNLRIPFISVALSLTFFHFCTASIANTIILKSFFEHEKNAIIRYCYLYLMGGVTYELYYGLKYGDRKHYTPWIITKSVEIFLIILSIISCCCVFGVRRYSGRYPCYDFVLEIIYGVIILILNMILTYSVMVRSYDEYQNDRSYVNNAVNVNRQGVFYMNGPQNSMRYK